MNGETLNSGIEELETGGESTANPGQEGVDTPTSTGSETPVPDFLTKPTGSGPVSSYVDHPMNFRNSDGLARMIRGFEGLLGQLDYWPVDVTIGLMQEIWEWISRSPGETSESDTVGNLEGE